MKYLCAELAVLSSLLNTCDNTDILPEAETKVMSGLTFMLWLWKYKEMESQKKPHDMLSLKCYASCTKYMNIHTSCMNKCWTFIQHLCLCMITLLTLHTLTSFDCLNLQYWLTPSWSSASVSLSCSLFSASSSLSCTSLSPLSDWELTGPQASSSPSHLVSYMSSMSDWFPEHHRLSACQWFHVFKRWVPYYIGFRALTWALSIPAVSSMSWLLDFPWLLLNKKRLASAIYILNTHIVLCSYLICTAGWIYIFVVMFTILWQLLKVSLIDFLALD